jgi:hypothetical protein
MFLEKPQTQTVFPEAEEESTQAKTKVITGFYGRQNKSDNAKAGG